jgi:pimeloyl-ACP methyl ester carboxylesterase
MSLESGPARLQNGPEERSPTAATFVLLPGAGGDSWYWHLVASRLRARGHEVLTPDLPADDDTAGLGEYADTVVNAIGDRAEVIVVAQSMAAFTAPMLCERVDVRLLILVAPMIPAPGESPGAWWSNTGQTAARRSHDEMEGRDSDAAFDVRTTFMRDVPPEVVDEAFARGEPRQSDTPFSEPWPLAAWPTVPTRVVAGRYDRLFSLEFMRELAIERLGIAPDVMDAGHLPALSRRTSWHDGSRTTAHKTPRQFPRSESLVHDALPIRGAATGPNLRNQHGKERSTVSPSEGVQLEPSRATGHGYATPRRPRARRLACGSLLTTRSYESSIALSGSC